MKHFADYVIDYISAEFNNLVEYNEGHYQWQGDKPVHELYQLYNADGVIVYEALDAFLLNIREKTQ